MEGIDVENMWFPHDAVLCDTSNATVVFLEKIFGNRRISRANANRPSDRLISLP